MPRVVVNSTPIIVLCGIDQLDVLHRMYHEIFIPAAVYQEVTAVKDSACIQIMTQKNWIHVEEIQDVTEKKMYKAKLHAGEVEVMILAQEKQADLVILDDNAAKKTAKYLGLTVTGTLGVLLKAKQKGIIENVSPLLSKMKQNGFYMGPKLEAMVLKSAGEECSSAGIK